MPRSKLSLPHERRKMALRSMEMKLKVGIAENRERLGRVRNELSAMRPAQKPKDPLA
jgi:hypothetical protein